MQNFAVPVQLLEFAVLVVDTGMGPVNAARVLESVEDIAAGRKIYLTTTHFHPEHSYGAATFAPQATILMNKSQVDDIKNKKEKNPCKTEIINPEFLIENENPENQIIVNHINENKLNNYCENLEWCTYGENNNHSIKKKLMIFSKQMVIKNIF